MIGSESLKYNFSKKKFMVPDLETSCLNLAMGYNRPWQVSWLICQGTEIIKKNNYYLRWPDFYISPGAAAATRFDPRNIELYGQDPKEILDLFDKDLYNEEYIIVGQNLLNFDVYIHSMWRENFGNSIDYSYIDRIIDVRALAVCWKLGLKFKETEDFLAQQYRFLSVRKKGLKTNLAQLCRDLGIAYNPDEMHDALVDIKKTFEVFHPLVKQLEI